MTGLESEIGQMILILFRFDAFIDQYNPYMHQCVVCLVSLSVARTMLIH